MHLLLSRFSFLALSMLSLFLWCSPAILSLHSDCRFSIRESLLSSTCLNFCLVKDRSSSGCIICSQHTQGVKGEKDRGGVCIKLAIDGSSLVDTLFLHFNILPPFLMLPLLLSRPFEPLLPPNFRLKLIGGVNGLGHSRLYLRCSPYWWWSWWLW